MTQEDKGAQKKPATEGVYRKTSMEVNTSWSSRTYKEATLGHSPQNKAVKELILTGEGALFPKHCIGRSIIGVAKDLSCLNEAKGMLDKVGKKDVAIVYIGGLNLLITFKDKKEANCFIKDERPQWGPVFDSVTLWSGQEFEFDRIVELRMYGVPLVWRDDVTYEKIGNLFGRVVEGASFSWANLVVDSGSVKVLTNKMNSIDEMISVHWRDRTFKVWVKEVGVQFVPRFVTKEHEDKSLEEGEIDTGYVHPTESSPKTGEGNHTSQMGEDGQSGSGGELEESLWGNQSVHGNEKGLHGNRSNIKGHSQKQFEPGCDGFNIGSGLPKNRSSPNKRGRKRHRTIEEHNNELNNSQDKGVEFHANNSGVVSGGEQPNNAAVDQTEDVPMLNPDDQYSGDVSGGEQPNNAAVDQTEVVPVLNPDDQNQHIHENETVVNEPAGSAGPEPDITLIMEEVKATVEIGEMLGCDLGNHVNMVVDEVTSELGNNVFQ